MLANKTLKRVLTESDSPYCTRDTDIYPVRRLEPPLSLSLVDGSDQAVCTVARVPVSIGKRTELWRCWTGTMNENVVLTQVRNELRGMHDCVGTNETGRDWLIRRTQQEFLGGMSCNGADIIQSYESACRTDVQPGNQTASKFAVLLASAITRGTCSPRAIASSSRR